MAKQEFQVRVCTDPLIAPMRDLGMKFIKADFPNGDQFVGPLNARSIDDLIHLAMDRYGLEVREQVAVAVQHRIDNPAVPGESKITDPAIIAFIAKTLHREAAE